MAITTIKKLPGVLSFSRGHMVSSGMFFSKMADGSELPVPVLRAGIRGTQNTNDGLGNESPKKVAPAKSPKKAAAVASASEGAEITVAATERAISNVQVTESAKLDINARALVVRFNMAMLDLANALDSCAGVDRESTKNMRDSVQDFIDRAKKTNAVYDVALRYARNIANGRWLWRNRLIASDIEISVKHKSGDKSPIAVFDAFEIPGKHFNDFTPQEHALAKEIAAQMKGDSRLGLEVTAVIIPRFGGDVEIFPSQNFANTPKGFSRALYKIGQPDPLSRFNSVQEFQDTRHMGYAALRDQKIFNAIRTIDTWYAEYETTGEPISVEPLGANLTHQTFYRKGKQSAFDMFKRLAVIDPTSDEGLFCIASLDRGGVYGETDKMTTPATSAAVADTVGAA
jgi:CRISPR-associated protein Csy3